MHICHFTALAILNGPSLHQESAGSHGLEEHKDRVTAADRVVSLCKVGSKGLRVLLFNDCHPTPIKPLDVLKDGAHGRVMRSVREVIAPVLGKSYAKVRGNNEQSPGVFKVWRQDLA